MSAVIATCLLRTGLEAGHKAILAFAAPVITGNVIAMRVSHDETLPIACMSARGSFMFACLCATLSPKWPSFCEMGYILLQHYACQPHTRKHAHTLPQCANQGCICMGLYRNLRLLEAAGAELVPFSPIEDGLPVQLAGVYLGGGYPERHCHRLSANKAMRAALLAFAKAGGVVYGECGGLLYLTQSLQPLSDLPNTMGRPSILNVSGQQRYIAGIADRVLLYAMVGKAGPWVWLPETACL